MKKINFILLTLFAIALTSCEDKAEEYVTYTVNDPVFMSVSEFRSSVTVKETPQPIKQHGKISFYNNYLYISEPGKGIHIIDNRDTKHPKNIAFIELIGNADMSIRDNLLYADSYIDLVWFDVSNPAKPILKGRKEEVFPQALPPTENQFGYDYQKCMDRSNGIVVAWNVKEEKQRVEHYNSGWWGGSKDYADAPMLSNGGRNTSINGSMSRFTIYKDYLYTAMGAQLDIFDLSAETPVKATEKISLGRIVETIFSYKDNLFFGTPTGMLIYSVENPTHPAYQSAFSHIYGCDPVVVEDDIAYVTIRAGNMCGQNANELFIVDVKDVKQPKQIVSYTMTSPKGLGIDNKTLFVCDDGLKVFDASNPQTIMGNKLAHFSSMDGFDVIPFNHTLMMIADDGIYQYDYTNVKEISLLSKLPVGK